MGYIFFSIVFLAIAAVCLIKWKKMSAPPREAGPGQVVERRPRQQAEVREEAGRFRRISGRPSFWFGLGAAGLLLWITMTLGCGVYKVDAGEAAMLIQFGNPYHSESTAGLHVMRPWASLVVWPIRFQTLNETIEARTSDEMIMNLDITVWWAVDPSKIEIIYSKIARDYESLLEGFVMPGIRSAVRDEIGKSTFSDILVNRGKYADMITKYVADQLVTKHVFIDKVNIRNVTPPPAVNEAIEAKMKAQQKQEQMNFELEIAKKDAEIRRVHAKGVADAQYIIQATLTPIYVQYEGIQALKELAKSQNSTYIMVPMSASGSGVPMVWGAPIK